MDKVLISKKFESKSRKGKLYATEVLKSSLFVYDKGIKAVREIVRTIPNCSCKGFQTHRKCWHINNLKKVLEEKKGPFNLTF